MTHCFVALKVMLYRCYYTKQVLRDTSKRIWCIQINIYTQTSINTKFEAFSSESEVHNLILLVHHTRLFVISVMNKYKSVPFEKSGC